MLNFKPWTVVASVMIGACVFMLPKTVNALGAELTAIEKKMPEAKYYNPSHGSFSG